MKSRKNKFKGARKILLAGREERIASLEMGLKGPVVFYKTSDDPFPESWRVDLEDKSRLWAYIDLIYKWEEIHIESGMKKLAETIPEPKEVRAIQFVYGPESIRARIELFNEWLKSGRVDPAIYQQTLKEARAWATENQYPEPLDYSILKATDFPDTGEGAADHVDVYV